MYPILSYQNIATLTPVYQWCSGAGTAFPHKKFSGNDVPTREILRVISINQNLQSFSALKLISKGICSIYKVNGYVVSQNL